MRIEIPKIGVNLRYSLPNRYNGADQMFLFKIDVSFIIKRLSSNFKIER